MGARVYFIKCSSIICRYSPNYLQISTNNVTTSAALRRARVTAHFATQAIAAAVAPRICLRANNKNAAADGVQRAADNSAAYGIAAVVANERRCNDRRDLDAQRPSS